jgi:phenylalanyl-tRNA synthetase beta chain
VDQNYFTIIATIRKTKEKIKGKANFGFRRFLSKLPVVELSLSRLARYAKNRVNEAEILDSLPYIGLDIESVEGDSVRVEYNPNRPDFSSEAGIARSLVGLFGIETGIPKYSFPEGPFVIEVDSGEIKNVRPHIRALSAQIKVSEELLKQLIAMQEDLHNGIGKKRAEVAIGFHNSSVIRPPVRYFATRDKSFSFQALGSIEKSTIEDILHNTEQGRSYSHILSQGIFPILADADGTVLSMPPIINGEITRVKEGVESLFVDVTSVSKENADTTIAIIASMLSDVGAQVQTVSIIDNTGQTIKSPEMNPKSMRFDLDLVNAILGMDLGFDEAKKALQRTRLDLWAFEEASIPRYRNDILHAVDLAEEVALGYGIRNITPQRMPKSSLSGRLDPRLCMIDLAIEAIIGLGFTELMNYSLEGEFENSLGSDRSSNGSLKVEQTRSKNYEYLRSELLPTLLTALSLTSHEEYPQRVFEIGRVFKRSQQSETGVAEEEHIAVVIADSEARYTSIRSVFEAFAKLALRDSGRISFSPYRNPSSVFAPGRSASISFAIDSRGRSLQVGIMGEISPATLEKIGLKIPVSAFELNLEPWLSKV